MNESPKTELELLRSLREACTKMVSSPDMLKPSWEEQIVKILQELKGV